MRSIRNLALAMSCVLFACSSSTPAVSRLQFDLKDINWNGMIIHGAAKQVAANSGIKLVSVNRPLKISVVQEIRSKPGADPEYRKLYEMTASSDSASPTDIAISTSTGHGDGVITVVVESTSLIQPQLGSPACVVCMENSVRCCTPVQ